jgi:hypothetical protein
MGRCLCDSVTYSADAEPVVQAVDHGEETQRSFCSARGSPVFSSAAVAPELAFVKAAQPWSPHFEHAARMERGPQ